MGQIGRYSILESVGEGGMAQVFRARLEGPMGFQKELAIKRIRDDVVRAHGDHVRSLINEARIGGQLRHPNLVEVYELGEDDGAYYIAMEFVDGYTFQEVLDVARREQGRVPPNVALDIATQVCRGLAHAHRFRGEGGAPLHLVHRDMKPGNVMITLDGVAKVMDFGIAKASSNLFDTTDPGQAKGTPLYMSPEQLRGVRPLTSASDLWAVGVMLYEMATGRLLFRGRTVPEIITRVLNFPLERVIARGDAAISGLGPLLARLLVREPAARLADAAEVARELERLSEWQDQRVTLRDFMHAWHEGRHDLDPPPPEPATPAEAASPSPVEAERELRESGAATPVERNYLRERRRSRAATLTVVLPLVLGGAGLLGEYVWRRTVAAERMFASAEASMEAGQPAEALRLCGEVLSARPGLVDARFTAAMLGAWASIPKEEGLRSLEHAPEDETPDFARKYEAFAWVLRRSGEVEPSFRYLRLAMDKLRDAGRSLPPSLVWSAAEAAVLLGSEGENAIIRGTADGGRALWREVEGLLPPGAERDIARAWVEALDAGREPYLRAELLWLDGRWEPAWSTFEAALRLTPDGLPNGDRRVWAYRALGDGRWTLAAALSTAHPGADDETRRADAVARLIALAATGKVEEARRGMPELLRSASGAEERAKLRLLLARALMREHLDPEWTGALLSEAAAELMDPNDPDILLLNASAAKPGPFEEALSLSWDPRTGRLFRGALRRAGPTPSHLVSGTEYTRVNRPPSGGPWFFGPAWSPVTGGSLPVRYHPGR